MALTRLLSNVRTHFFTFLVLVTAATAQFTCNGGTLSIVAHADDDLLFQAPYIFSPLNANCFPTVFISGGDAGYGTWYANERERGNEAAKAAYLGVSNSWSETTAQFAGQSVTIRTLRAMPGVQNIYFRLPDGNIDGSGFSYDDYPSLLNLYAGYVGSLTSIDERATYTIGSLRQALGQIISTFNPSNVITQDYLSDLGSGDHSDHLVVARIVAGLVGTYAPSASLSGFMGYPASAFPPTGDQDHPDYQAKADMFFQYTPYDFLECQSYSACADAGRAETSWLLREYVVDSQLAQTFVRTVPPTVDFSKDLALLGSASASSFASGQPPSGAIDGIIGGYRADGTGNEANEWSSNRQGQGAYWQVRWDYPVSVTSIILYDRPNLDDQITSGSITLDDGNTLSFGFLPNNGSGYAIPIGNVTTTSVFVRVGSVGYRTVNAGLSEVVVLGSVLDGSTNDTIPIPGPGSGTSFAWSNDIALFASASASSSAPDQGAAKAIDGQLGGYDGLAGDYTQEWSSNGEGVGASLLLSWSRPVEIYSVLAYDRPNADDQITSATIAFGDGTRVQVGTLMQDGSATFISLPNNVTTTTLRFTVTGVSASTKNVGLRELVVLGSYATPGAGSTNGTNSTTTPPVNGWTNDLALQALVTASSYDPASPPSGAVDAIIGGYLPEGGEDHTEWSSLGEKAGAWINLQWANPVAASSVVLYDRINLDDQVTSGTLSFDDGSSILVGQLPNDGTGVSISLGNKTIQELRFTVNSVSGSTVNVGLAEIAVFGSGLSNPINGTDGNGTPIGGGGTGSNTTLPVPGGNGTTNGTLPGTGDLPSTPSANVALLAIVSASSSSPDQGAEKARDGVIDGYTDDGGDYTKEWASNGQGAGAWIQYDWVDSPVTISNVRLNDRPNLNDQILSGTITFSDGTSQSVGTLPNDGSALSVAAAKDQISWLRFTVGAVSQSTLNIGLAELAVIGYSSSNATSRRVSGPLNATESTTVLANTTAAAPTSLSSNTTVLQDSMNATATLSASVTIPTGFNTTLTISTTMPGATMINSTATVGNFTTSIPSNSSYTISNNTTLPTGMPTATMMNSTTSVPSNSTSTISNNTTLPTGMPTATMMNSTTSISNNSRSTISSNNALTASNALPLTTGVNLTTAFNSSSAAATGTPTITTNIPSSLLSRNASVGTVTGMINSTSSMLFQANTTTIITGSTSSSFPIFANSTAASSDNLTSSVSTLPASASTTSSSSGSASGSSSLHPTPTPTSSSSSFSSSSNTSSISRGSSSWSQSTSTMSTSSTLSSSNPSSSSRSSASSSESTTSRSTTVSTAASTSQSSTPSRVTATPTSPPSSLPSSTTSTRSTSSSAAPSSAETANVARSGTCRASSSGAGTSCRDAIDGNVAADSEWTADSNSGVGAWIQIDLAARSTLTSIRLFDRQGTSSGIQAGLLTFSDGSSSSVSTISKTGTTISLGRSGKSSTFVRFTVSSVASGNSTVGLAEMEIYGTVTQGSQKRRRYSNRSNQRLVSRH